MVDPISMWLGLTGLNAVIFTSLIVCLTFACMVAGASRKFTSAYKNLSVFAFFVSWIITILMAQLDWLYLVLPLLSVIGFLYYNLRSGAETIEGEIRSGGGD